MKPECGAEEAARALGITLRQLQNYRRMGLTPVRIGPRNKAWFSVERCRTWIARNVRTTPLGGRPRRANDQDHRSGRNSGPLPALWNTSPEALVTLINDGKIGAGSVATLKQAFDAMERHLDYRTRMEELVEASDVAQTLSKVLGPVRTILDNIPDAIVAAVGGVVLIDEPQRATVRGAAAREIDAAIDLLRSIGGA